jgi:hypothetical protein
MASKTKKATLGQQIKEALDGRTQRWLALKIEMSEDKLSNKLKDLTPFTDEDLTKINSVLETNFTN